MNRNVPAVAYDLWNPDAAARWGLLLSPAFGAWLHAMNWREIGEPRLARANMIWVWATFALLALNLATLFVHLPRSAEALARFSGILLWAAWFWSLGRKQVRYVKDFAGFYIKKRWPGPLLVAILALGLYFAVCIGLVYAAFPSLPKDRDPATVAAWVRPRILNKWHEEPRLRDASIQSIVLDQKNGGTYAGVIEATIEGKPEKFGLNMELSSNRFSWKLNALHERAGEAGRK